MKRTAMILAILATLVGCAPRYEPSAPCADAATAAIDARQAPLTFPDYGETLCATHAAKAREFGGCGIQNSEYLAWPLCPWIQTADEVCDATLSATCLRDLQLYADNCDNMRIVWETECLPACGER